MRTILVALRLALVLPLLALVYAVLLPTSARAADEFGVITLDLRAQDAGAPTHLCVVAEAQGPRTRKKLWDVLEPSDDRDAASKAAGTWLVLPDAWEGDETSANRHLCSAGGGDCRPRVELPPKLERSAELFVACTADGLVESDPSEGARPVFVLLEHLEGSPPAIESVRLTGGVATVGVAADLGPVIVTARSLGGYYLPDKISLRAETERQRDAATGPVRKDVTLSLMSRCRLVEVTLPGTRLTREDRGRLSVNVHGMPFDTDRCVESELDNTTVLQIRVPPAPLGVGSIEVSLAGTEAGKAAAKYGASYYKTWPVTPFALTFKQVTFSWRRPKCIYPESSCPVATLENGTTCAPEVTEEGCAYTCPGSAGEDALDLQLPLSVSFEKEDPTQKWEDKLVQNGQQLTSYVPSHETYVGASIREWKADEPANRVSGVELFTEDGAAVNHGVTGVRNLQLRVPGASCEPLRFKPVGDRQYSDAIATIADGQIELGNPKRLARRVSVNLMVLVGGGPAWSDISPSNQLPPIYFNGLAMFALEYRARKRGWSRIGWELRVGGTLGRWGELVEETSEDDTQDNGSPLEGSATTSDERRFSQARVLIEPGLVFAAHDRVGVGFGYGVGASFPIREQQDLTQERIEFIHSPALDARFYLARWIGLVFQTRFVFGERAFGVVGGEPADPVSPLVETSTVSASFKARSLLLLFGAIVRF